MQQYFFKPLVLTWKISEHEVGHKSIDCCGFQNIWCRFETVGEMLNWEIFDEYFYEYFWWIFFQNIWCRFETVGEMLNWENDRGILAGKDRLELKHKLWLWWKWFWRNGTIIVWLVGMQWKNCELKMPTSWQYAGIKEAAWKKRKHDLNNPKIIRKCDRNSKIIGKCDRCKSGQIGKWFFCLGSVWRLLRATVTALGWRWILWKSEEQRLGGVVWEYFKEFVKTTEE